MLLSWYIIVYHLRDHDISCPSPTHDITLSHLFFGSMSYHVNLISRSWWCRDMIPTHDIIMIYHDITPNSNLALHAVHPTWYHMISHDIMPPTTAQAPRTQTVISRYIMWYHESWYHMISHDIWHDTRIREHRDEHKISNDMNDMEMIINDMEMTWQPYGTAWLLRSLLSCSGRHGIS